MKDKEKRVGTKALLIIIILVFGFVMYSMFSSFSGGNALPEPTLQFKPDNPNSKLEAAIVDHLSLSAPNQTFMETAASILTGAGYVIDYYSGEKVNVEFYKNLPTGEYDLIILRVHSALSARNVIGLFSSERYSKSKYVNEQLNDQVIPAVFSDEDQQKGIIYFGITPLFVTQRMNRRFKNTTIILMGCEGLANPTMAESFVQKGVKAYISWSGPVSPSHTDKATTHLLQHLLTEKRTVEESVIETFKEVGFDPTYYNSFLVYYPPEAGDYHIKS